MRILSTKKLTAVQRDQLKGFEVVEQSMIEISYGEGFRIDENVKNAVFTSANSVRSVFLIHKNSTAWFDSIFCVGQKTKDLLEMQGLEVGIVANNAMELADILAERFATEQDDLKEINWFCGNLRNKDLPNILAENGVLLTEYIVYQTKLTPVKVATNFDAVLFFSPSAIRSYLKENKSNLKPVVCIGASTAVEAIQHFENVYMADTTTVESVIEKVKEII